MGQSRCLANGWKDAAESLLRDIQLSRRLAFKQPSALSFCAPPTRVNPVLAQRTHSEALGLLPSNLTSEAASGKVLGMGWWLRPGLMS